MIKPNEICDCQCHLCGRITECEDESDAKSENLNDIIKENVEACERPDYPEEYE